MDVIAITRQLGAAIQKDECYLKFVAAKDASEADSEVKDMMNQINDLRDMYQEEASKENPDQTLLQKYDGDFQNLYTSLMTNDKMNKYEECRQELDEMMNHLMQILYLCVNGENPETCEPPKEEEHNCGGSCSSCCGC